MFTRGSTGALDELGGIAHAAPYATDLTAGDQQIADGFWSLHTPGHTKGHVVYHVDDRWLFTGGTLSWNHRRQELDVTPKQTWFSWDVLADSMTASQHDRSTGCSPVTASGITSESRPTGLRGPYSGPTCDASDNVTGPTSPTQPSAGTDCVPTTRSQPADP